METIFKVGDKVWDMSISNEVGEVVEIIQGYNYPIRVEFKNDVITYTFDGIINTGHLKTLSFTPYTFEGFSQERPKKEPEIGSLCLFSDDVVEFRNNNGYVDFLLEKAIDYTAQDGSYWRFCKQIEIKDV